MYEPMITCPVGDITKLRGYDVIVNAAKETLAGGGGVDGAIHAAAGPELLRECLKIRGCMTGGAKLTSAYDLPARFIIHTVGPVYADHPERVSEELLEMCYVNCLKMADSIGVYNIAFPAISTGIYGFPLKMATSIAVRTALAYRGNLSEISFVCFDQETQDVYHNAIRAELNATMREVHGKLFPQWFE